MDMRVPARPGTARRGPVTRLALLWAVLGCGAGSPVLAADPPPRTTLARDAQGVTMRAVCLTAPLTFDGRLDDEVYRAVPPAGDFVQQIPLAGVPATEATDVWVLFDDRNFYVSARCYDSHLSVRS